MPLLPSGCDVDVNLIIDVYNEVDSRSCGCSHLLALSARFRHIMILDKIFTGRLPVTRRGDRDVMSLQDQSPSTASSPLQRKSPEAGFRWGVYGDNMIGQQSSLDVSSNPNEWSHSWAIRTPPPKKKINNIDDETTPLC